MGKDASPCAMFLELKPHLIRKPDWTRLKADEKSDANAIRLGGKRLLPTVHPSCLHFGNGCLENGEDPPPQLVNVPSLLSTRRASIE